MITLTHTQTDHYIITSKPNGWPTHRVTTNGRGWSELVESSLQLPAKVVHRLDADTSGVIVLATSSDAAAEASSCFEARTVEKQYLLVTDRTISTEQVTVESTIERRGSLWHSENSETPNARTLFTHLRTEGTFSFWQASPITGKTHQIRLHAQQLGIPILGDTLYGGSRFPRLMLHAASLNLGAIESLNNLSAAPSILFERPQLCAEPVVANWIQAIERRTLTLDFIESDCLRLIHTEGGTLRADRFGTTLALYWFGDSPPSSTDYARFEQLLPVAQCSRFVVYDRSKKAGGAGVSRQKSHATDGLDTWLATENDVKVELRHAHGTSPGLFLDQREQRAYVLGNSKEKRVLNLFSYTSLFSVAAALGGASEVVSVDTSKSALEWSKQNFAANGLTDLSRYKFYVKDCREFLKVGLKREERFDIIICDPPSFSHGKKKVFKLKSEMDWLLTSCLDLLNDGGALFFSCNLEQFSVEEFHRYITRHPATKGMNARFWSPSLDFELPGEEPLLKSVLLMGK